MRKLSSEEIYNLIGFETFLEEFKQDGIEKFVKGAKEHKGEDPLELDHFKEMKHEIIDLLAYMYFYLDKKQYEDTFYKGIDSWLAAGEKYGYLDYIGYKDIKTKPTQKQRQSKISLTGSHYGGYINNQSGTFFDRHTGTFFTRRLH